MKGDRATLLFAAFLYLLAGLVHAQPVKPWSDRPITFVIGLAPGGATDVTARVVAAALTERLGQTVIVDNRTGAGGTVAGARVARAAPDGYTFEIRSISSAVINAFVYKQLTYDPIKDFVAVSLVGRAPLVAVVRSDMPAKNMAEFVALAKQNPGKFTYGSSGSGTILHIAGELFNKLAGVQLVHVPYRGAALALNDVLAGNITLLFDAVGSVSPHLDAGKLRSLGVTTLEPTPFMPLAPLVSTTVPGFAVDSWFGIFAPAQTSNEMVNRLAKEIAAVVRDPAIAARFKQLGYEAIGSTPAEFDKFWKSELAKFGPLIKELGVTLD